MNNQRFLVTMQYNERTFLPIFIEHYSKYFSPENIYIVDHGSSENLIPTKFNRIFIPRRNQFSELDRLSFVSSICHGLLAYYDYGVYADCDELICLDGVDINIFERSTVIYVAGFECTKILLNNKEVLVGVNSPDECKPLIFKTLPNWVVGFHGATEPPLEELTIPMAHIKYLSEAEALERANIRIDVHRNMNLDEKQNGVDGHWLKSKSDAVDFYLQINKITSNRNKLDTFTAIKRSDFFNQRIKQSTLYVKPTYTYIRKGTYRDFSSPVDLSKFFPTLI